MEIRSNALNILYLENQENVNETYSQRRKEVHQNDKTAQDKLLAQIKTKERGGASFNYQIASIGLRQLYTV